MRTRTALMSLAGISRADIMTSAEKFVIKDKVAVVGADTGPEDLRALIQAIKEDRVRVVCVQSSGTSVDARDLLRVVEPDVESYRDTFERLGKAIAAGQACSAERLLPVLSNRQTKNEVLQDKPWLRRRKQKW